MELWSIFNCSGKLYKMTHTNKTNRRVYKTGKMRLKCKLGMWKGMKLDTEGCFSPALLQWEPNMVFFYMTLQGRGALSATLVLLWASEHGWSLCCSEFWEPVWHWSWRPYSHFTLRDVSQIQNQNQDGIIKFEYNHKAVPPLCHTRLSLFDPKKRRIEDCGLIVTCSVSKSSRGLVIPERSGEFQQSPNLTCLVFEPQVSGLS